jgi:hypothetical protein
MAFESHPQEEPAGDAGSNRNFGWLLAGALVVVGLWPLWRHQDVRWWAMALGLGFGVVALVAPSVLDPLRCAWMKFGWLLGKIVSPVVMGVLLYAVVTPVGLFQRLFRRDQLRLKWDREAKSYWQNREPPGPPPDSMTNQF